jgi:glycerol kinase
MAMVGDSHAALFGHALGELGAEGKPPTARLIGDGAGQIRQCDIDALATTIAWHEATASGLEGNIPAPAMPWRGWRTAPA